MVRFKVNKIGSVIKCSRCGCDLITRSTNHIYCNICADIIIKERTKYHNKNRTYNPKRNIKRSDLHKVSYHESGLERLFMAIIVYAYNDCVRYLKRKKKLTFDSENYIINDANTTAKKNRADTKREHFKSGWNFIFGGNDSFIDYIGEVYGCKRAIRKYRELLLKAKEGENVPEANVDVLYDHLRPEERE